MLQNNKGYFLLDLLLSLSALFLVTLYLTPMLMDLREQSGRLEIEKTARQLMFQELQAKLIHSNNPANYAITKNGIEYQIYWREFSGMMEVCVKVEETPLHSKTEVCGPFE
jgi:competence protein ComGE